MNGDALLGDPLGIGIPVFQIVATIAWFGVIIGLFNVARVWSRAMAWIFLVSGLLLPVGLMGGWVAFSGLSCSEDTLNSGYSDDYRLRYAITESACGAGDVARYKVSIGRNTDFPRMHTAFSSVGWPVPNGITQLDATTFRVEMAGFDSGPGDTGVVFEVDPVTGRPLASFNYVEGESVAFPFGLARR